MGLLGSAAWASINGIDGQIAQAEQDCATITADHAFPCVVHVDDDQNVILVVQTPAEFNETVRTAIETIDVTTDVLFNDSGLPPRSPTSPWAQTRAIVTVTPLSPNDAQTTTIHSIDFDPATVGQPANSSRCINSNDDHFLKLAALFEDDEDTVAVQTPTGQWLITVAPADEAPDSRALVLCSIGS